MTLLAPQGIGITGLNPTYTAVANGDAAVPGDRVFLHVKNGSGSPVTVTIVVPGTEFGQARADVPVVIAASGAQFIGPLVRDLADTSTHHVSWTFSSTTTVTAALLNV